MLSIGFCAVSIRQQPLHCYAAANADATTYSTNTDDTTDPTDGSDTTETTDPSTTDENTNTEDNQNLFVDPETKDNESNEN